MAVRTEMFFLRVMKVLIAGEHAWFPPWDVDAPLLRQHGLLRAAFPRPGKRWRDISGAATTSRGHDKGEPSENSNQHEDGPGGGFFVTHDEEMYNSPLTESQLADKLLGEQMEVAGGQASPGQGTNGRT